MFFKNLLKMLDCSSFTAGDNTLARVETIISSKRIHQVLPCFLRWQISLRIPWNEISSSLESLDMHQVHDGSRLQNRTWWWKWQWSQRLLEVDCFNLKFVVCIIVSEIMHLTCMKVVQINIHINLWIMFCAKHACLSLNKIWFHLVTN